MPKLNKVSLQNIILEAGRLVLQQEGVPLDKPLHIESMVKVPTGDPRLYKIIVRCETGAYAAIGITIELATDRISIIGNSKELNRLSLYSYQTEMNGLYAAVNCTANIDVAPIVKKIDPITRSTKLIRVDTSFTVKFSVKEMMTIQELAQDLPQGAMRAMLLAMSTKALNNSITPDDVKDIRTKFD
jgi:hypothetical protein